MAGNPHPFGSVAWTEFNAQEVASRPTALLIRKPFTAEDFKRYAEEGKRSREKGKCPDGITIKFIAS
jgi:hypothetical protein